jgi:tricorn protease
VVLLAGPAAKAQDPIRMARTPDISPDGKLIAFSYLGDIWTVESVGGVAKPVTQHVAHDYAPRFSPDGQSIAFASKRHGSYDVFVAAARGGRPRRLTYDSADDVPCGWSPDGKQVLFVSNRVPVFPSQADLFTVPAEGGRVHRVTTTEAREGTYSPRGDRIAYARGPGAWYRKGYRGSSNNDIWTCDASGNHHQQLTQFNGQDASPMWSADGQTVYYVSEYFGGPANVVRQSADGKGKPVLVTGNAAGKPCHTTDGVRQARISGNGEWIVYECGGDLWVVGTKPGSTPRSIPIEVYADDKNNPKRSVSFTNKASEFALAKDEKFVILTIHGELFLRPVQTTSSTTRRLTSSPANDHGVAWAPDSSKIVFISDRNGHDDLYLMEANDPEHPKFTDAHQFKVKQLTHSQDAEAGVSFSPDGSRVAFLRSGKLWTMKPDGTDQKALVDEVQVIDYEWSPDGKWVVYSRMDGEFASELYVMPAKGGKSRNVTRFATENVGVTWSANGKRLCFLSNRRGNQGLYVMDLQKEAAPGAPASNELDWDDIHHRTKLVTPMGVREGAISSDGEFVAFTGSSSSNADLWVANVSSGSMVRITTGHVRPVQITWSRTSKHRLFFRDAAGQFYVSQFPYYTGSGAINLGALGSSGSSSASAVKPSNYYAALPFKARMTIDDSELNLEIFDQSWRYLAEHFYDKKFHGADWEQVRARYRPLVRHVDMKEDLYTLLYLMMGELNASHLGVSGPSSAPEETTAELGLLFDDHYQGRGLKIAEVLKRGPADKRGLTIKPGEFVLSIDGTEIAPDTNVSRVLNHRDGDSVVLLVGPAANTPLKDKAVRRVELKTISRGEAGQLTYDRWVEANARRVADLSGGKLGYIHIPSMNDEGLERFVRSLYSDNYDKEAIVLDVRFNGGGFTHDQVLNYLGSKKHTIFRFRDGGEGTVIRSFDRKWTRPLVLLTNNRSYSDAEIFPNAFRALKLGKLVGQATGGHVIGTTSFPLIDGSRFRIPRIGVYTTGGINMDKEGVRPDVEVIPHPEQLAQGRDVQVEKAVEVLKGDVIAWKKKQSGGTSVSHAGPPKMPPARPTSGAGGE